MVTVPIVACYFRKYQKTQPKHDAVHEKSGKIKRQNSTGRWWCGTGVSCMQEYLVYPAILRSNTKNQAKATLPREKSIRIVTQKTTKNNGCYITHVPHMTTALIIMHYF